MPEFIPSGQEGATEGAAGGANPFAYFNLMASIANIGLGIGGSSQSFPGVFEIGMNLFGGSDSIGGSANDFPVDALKLPSDAGAFVQNMYAQVPAVRLQGADTLGVYADKIQKEVLDAPIEIMRNDLRDLGMLDALEEFDTAIQSSRGQGMKGLEDQLELINSTDKDINIGFEEYVQQVADQGGDIATAEAIHDSFNQRTSSRLFEHNNEQFKSLMEQAPYQVNSAAEPGDIDIGVTSFMPGATIDNPQGTRVGGRFFEPGNSFTDKFYPELHPEPKGVAPETIERDVVWEMTGEGGSAPGNFGPGNIDYDKFFYSPQQAADIERETNRRLQRQEKQPRATLTNEDVSAYLREDHPAPEVQEPTVDLTNFLSSFNPPEPQPDTGTDGGDTTTGDTDDPDFDTNIPGTDDVPGTDIPANVDDGTGDTQPPPDDDINTDIPVIVPPITTGDGSGDSSNTDTDTELPRFDLNIPFGGMPGGGGFGSPSTPVQQVPIQRVSVSEPGRGLVAPEIHEYRPGLFPETFGSRRGILN